MEKYLHNHGQLAICLPYYEDNKSAWQAFLATVGYQRVGQRAFGKDVSLQT